MAGFLGGRLGFAEVADDRAGSGDARVVVVEAKTGDGGDAVVTEDGLEGFGAAEVPGGARGAGGAEGFGGALDGGRDRARAGLFGEEDFVDAAAAGRELVGEGGGVAFADEEGAGSSAWSVRTSAIVLAVATALIAWMSEIMVGTIGPAAQELGLSKIFVGVFVVAVMGNAVEHATAIVAAMKNRMDLSLSIAIGSSVQIALFVTPVLGSPVFSSDRRQ